jgi:hypothetical protein
MVTVSVSAEAVAPVRQIMNVRLARINRECIALFGGLFILSSLSKMTWPKAP